MATLSQGDYIGQVTLNTAYPTVGENWHYEFKTTGGKKLASVSVADLFEVFPELKPETSTSPTVGDPEQEWADKLRKAADYRRNLAANDELRGNFANNKEDK